MGAGASKDSGIDVYRGIDGILDNPEKFLSVGSIDLENTLFDLKKRCEGKNAGPTYTLIKELSSHYDSSFILTQNIDGLVRNLGIQYVEMHGNKDEKVVLYGEDIIFPPIANSIIKRNFADVIVIGTSMTSLY